MLLNSLDEVFLSPMTKPGRHTTSEESERPIPLINPDAKILKKIPAT